MQSKNTGNINSFADNIAKTVRAQANMISLLSAMQKTTTENTDVIEYEYEDMSGNIHTYSLPTYASISHKISSIEDSLRNLSSGRGEITLSGTDERYTIKVDTVPQTPSNIIGVANPETFTLDSNWFFESLMFPGAAVTIDLTGQVPEKAKEVQVLRVIVDSTLARNQNFWMNTLSTNSYSYIQLIQLFEENNIAYSEDLQTVAFPHINNNYYGEFVINADPEIINDNFYYTLDTIKYNTVSAAGIELGNNNILSKGDELYSTGTLFEIVEIDQNTNKVRLRTKTGSLLLGKGSSLTLYRDPERSKKLNIRFGANEYNFIYIKAISPENNILSNAWSECIKFSSNDLNYAGDESVKFSDFYASNIVDWGAKMLAEAKERKITAFEGKKPNAPVLAASDFKVTAINLHKRLPLLTEDLQARISAISAEKADIDALSKEISTQKASLRAISNLSEYNKLIEVINTNTVALSAKQTSYSSLVNALRTDTDFTIYRKFVPKYRIRGFFPIPEPVYYGIGNQREQEVIGFEIRYRYVPTNLIPVALEQFKVRVPYEPGSVDIHPVLYTTDKIKSVLTTGINTSIRRNNTLSTQKVSLVNNTGLVKKAADGLDISNGIINAKIKNDIEKVALFSDWTVVKSKIKERVYDDALGCYVWSAENTGDGTQININQVDIPITKGEAVQIQVRSISEAGYPENPLMSDWSNIVTIPFSSLETVDNADDTKITDIITEDFNRTEFVNILNQNGLIAHLSDALVSSDATKTSNFNHQAKFIAYVETDISTNVVKTVSMQDKIESLELKIADLQSKYNKLVILLDEKGKTSLPVINSSIATTATGLNSSNGNIVNRLDSIAGFSGTEIVTELDTTSGSSVKVIGNPVTTALKEWKKGTSDSVLINTSTN